MSRKVLDSNLLIDHWRRRSAGVHVTPMDAENWTDELIDIYRTDLIVSPVYLEFLVHAVSGDQVQLYERFLSRFDVLDSWDIRPEDMKEALRIARWVPRNKRQRRPRQLGDCLIRAIANRFGCDVVTAERDFPR